MHLQEQEKEMSPRHSAYIPSSVKLPLDRREEKYNDKYFSTSL